MGGYSRGVACLTAESFAASEAEQHGYKSRDADLDLCCFVVQFAVILTHVIVTLPEPESYLHVDSLHWCAPRRPRGHSCAYKTKHQYLDFEVR